MSKHAAATVIDIGDLVEQGRELGGMVRDKTLQQVRATHKAVQKHPYRAILIAMGAGAIAGFLLGRKSNT